VLLRARELREFWQVAGLLGHGSSGLLCATLFVQIFLCLAAYLALRFLISDLKIFVRILGEILNFLKGIAIGR